MRRAAGLALALLLSGCLATTTEETVPAVPELPVDLSGLLVVDHDHADVALHQLTTPNVAASGFTDLSLDGTPTDSNTALDVVGDWAVVGFAGTSSGFALVDVSDPANPVTVSHYAAPNTYGADVKFDAEAETVFLATQWTDPTNPANLPTYDAAAMLDPAHPTVWGVYVVDVADKENPVLESVLPVGGRGAHTVHYHVIGGAEYVFLTSYTFHNVGLGSKENPVTTKVIATKLVEGPDGKRRLEPVDEYTRNVDPAVVTKQEGRVFPHELTIGESPVDGKPYAWVSYWDHGLVVLDVSDPADLKVAGGWAGFEAGDGAFHYAATFPELIHGTQVTIVGPEWFSHETSGKWWALDTTDLADIRLLGFWTLPGEPAIETGYRFSPHNFDLYGTWVVGANYHGGVWIWDVERLVRHFGREVDANATMASARATFRLPLAEHGESKAPEGHSDLVDVVGYHVVARTPRSSFFGGESPFVWAVLLRDGHLVYSDMESGLATARFLDVPEDAQGMTLKGHGEHEH